MTTWLSAPIRSGSKTWRHLTADTDRELAEMERRLREPRHGKGNQKPHLDIDERKAKLALRYGARPEEG